MTFPASSLRLRLFILITLGVTAVVLAFSVALFYHLKEELIEEKAALEHPGQKDFVLHGSKTSDAEIEEILDDLIVKSLYTAGPLLLLVLALSWMIAGRSLRPIAKLNSQLAGIKAQNLEPSLTLEEGDKEFQEHVDHLNLLLARLGKSFDDLSGYAAKVAHELRTPTTILRLKVESAENDMDPTLREEMAHELDRLNHVIDQSLLIARAERGSIEWKSKTFDLADTVREIVGDFQLLAEDEKRNFVLEAPEKCLVESDPRYVKQILQGLLTNALVHGNDAIRVTLEAAKESARLTLTNGLKDSGEEESSSLGLGLRVVKALIAAQDRVTASTGVEGKFYKAELVFP